jgi:hypothetical protein
VHDAEKQSFDGTRWESREVCIITQKQLAELTESISYEPVFPINFKLPLLELPPEAARVDLSTVGGSGTFAMGYVIAFVDEDGDGELDLGQLDVEPEQVVARSVSNPLPDGRSISSYWVVYLDGQIDLENAIPTYKETLAALPQGFSLWHTKETPAEDPADAPLRVREVLSVDEPLQMFGDAALADSSLFCNVSELEVRYVPEAFTPEYGSAFCWDGGREYEGRRDSVYLGGCRLVADYERRSLAGLSSEDEVPEGWPCTVE